MRDQEQEEEINLLEYWNVLWRRKISIIVLCVVVVLTSMIISLRSPKFYKAETVFISSGSEAGGLGAALSSLPFAGALGGAAGIQTQADKILLILKSRTTADAVIRKFDLLKIFYNSSWDAAKGTWKNPEKPPIMQDAESMLNMRITKFNKSKEGAITISVEWKDPVLAADMANYYVTALTNFLNEKAINITIQVVDKALPPERKSRPAIKENMLLAGVASLFVGILIAFIVEYFEKK